MRLGIVIIAFLFVAMGAGCSGSNAPDGSAAQGASSPDTTLAGPTWRLVAFGEEADSLSVTKDAEITAVFSEGGRVSGSGGCNSYSASFERSGDSLTISRVASTKKACRPPLMEQERRFFSALRSVQSWRREDDRLDLTDGAGERLLRFVAN